MAKSRFGDYLTYGLGGTVLGAGAGLTGGSLINREGLATPAATMTGAGLGLGAGLLTAYLKNKNRQSIEDMKPGWYITEQPLYQIPDVGNVKARHSSHTIIVPRKDAEQLAKNKDWKDTERYDYISSSGKPMSAFQISTHMDSKSKPWRTLTFSRMEVPFKAELDTKEGWMPVTRAVEVPRKKNVKLVDVLKRLKKIEKEYEEGKTPIYTLFSASKMRAPGKGGHGNCHDITKAILANTEDLHSMSDWSPEGVASSQYERPEIRKARILNECKKELSKSYLGEVVKHTLGGALGGGIIGAGLPLLYGLDEVNPRLDKSKEQYRHLANAGYVGAAGAGLGGAAGALIGLTNTAIRRIRAQSRLNKLEKESAAQDYIMGGLGGAGIGAGAGMVMNAMTGRKLLSAPFLLGGIGVGTAGGLGVGLLRAHERKNQDMRVKPDSEAVYVDAEGHKRLKPGTYVGFTPARFLNEQQKYPILDNNIGHTFMFDVSDKPFSIKDNKTGKTINAVQMANGDYVMTHEVLLTKIKPGDPDYTGEPWKGSRYTMAVNGHVMGKDWDENKEDITQFGERGYGEIDNIYRSIRNDPGDDPKETYGKTMCYAVQFHDNQTPDDYSKRNQLIYNRSRADLGKEPLYSFYQKWLTGVDKRDCQTYVSYVLHHLARLGYLNRENIVKNLPRYLGTSLGADMHHGDLYNDTLGEFER